VVEKCDSETEAGKALPTPSPSILWDEVGVPSTMQVHRNVCRTAALVVEFSLKDINTFSITSTANADLIVNKCSSSSAVYKTQCDSPQQIELKDIVSPSNTSGKVKPQPISSLSLTASTSYIQLMPKTGKWENDTWYQVVLKSTINAGTTATNTAYLAKDRPCDDVSGSAYCFMFKTDNQDCKLKDVIVTPYKYWTNVLTGLIKQPISGLTYRALGLSEQRCVIMDVSGFKTTWSTASSTYAKIYNKTLKEQTFVESITSTASSEANTVGVGLKNPNDAVDIKATLSTTTNTVTGTSPLTIDLSNPQVVD
jgi:hypothetical protein